MTTIERAESYRPRDLAYTKARIERWAKIVCGAGHGGGISLTGRLMAGVKSNICLAWLDDMQAQRAHDPFCPFCGGRGRLELALREQFKMRHRACSICDPDGKFLGEWCWRCHGTRVVEVIVLRVNPAGIRGTKAVGGQAVYDPASVAIDELVSGWRAADATIWLHRVLVREYFYNGTQRMHAFRLRISLSFYKKRLHEAYVGVDSMLYKKAL